MRDSKELFALPIEDQQDRFIVGKMYYSKGGINYATYKQEPRGYYFSVSAIERTFENGFKVEKFTMFKGIKSLVAECKRFNQRTFDELQPTPEKIEQLIAYVENEEGVQRASDIEYRPVEVAA